MFSTTPCTMWQARQHAVAGGPAGIPAPNDCRQCQTARSVITRAKNSQKNQGLYFEYEKVDPEAHKQLPAQKERIQEEFGWVKRARSGPTFPSQQFSKQARFDKNKSNQRRYASRSTTGAASAVSQEGVAPTLQPSPQRTTLTNGIQSEPTSQPPTTSNQETQAAVQQTNVQMNDDNNVGSSTEQATVRSRKQMLLERMNATRPSPVTPDSSTVQVSVSDAAPVASTSSEQTAHSPGLSFGAATVATAAMASAAATSMVTASSSQSGQTSAQTTAATVDATSSTSESASLSLPPVPPVNDPSNTDEQKVRALLQDMLQLTETDMAQLDDIDFSALASQQNAADEEFSSWLSGVRNGIQPQGQQNSATGTTAYESENEDALKQAAEAQANISEMLASAGRDFADIQSLYKQLNEDDDAFSESLGPEIPEDQLLASLKATSPELFKLLSPGDGLDYTEEDQELEKALASFARLGFDKDSDDEGAAALLDVDTSLPKGIDNASVELLFGETDVGKTSKASKQDVQNDDDDELITDEELAALARHDPDLAALLQADNLGKNFEKLMNKAEGLDDDDDDAGNDNDEDGVEFSELFDAIDEEEELDEEGKARAKFELQSMFNAPSKRDQDTMSQPVLPRGPTTTGVAGLPKDAVPELRPRPKLD